jgi:F0F1-type ATP synthase epsilon subunit
MAKKQNASTGEVNEAKSDVPKGKFHLKVYAPFKVYYEGVVASISAENGTGPFDILADHHNFLTLLSPCDLVIRPESDVKEPETITITRGIMQVKANDVVVFLDV